MVLVALCSFQRSEVRLAGFYNRIYAVLERVTMAAGIHLFPFRTEKLSPPAPMVLRGRPRGRVGRRPFFMLGASRHATPFGLRFQHFSFLFVPPTRTQSGTVQQGPRFSDGGGCPWHPR